MFIVCNGLEVEGMMLNDKLMFNCLIKGQSFKLFFSIFSAWWTVPGWGGEWEVTLGEAGGGWAGQVGLTILHSLQKPWDQDTKGLHFLYMSLLFSVAFVYWVMDDSQHCPGYIPAK